MNKIIKTNWFIGIAAMVQTIASFAFINFWHLDAIFYALAIGFATKVVYTILRKGDLLHLQSEQRKVLLSQLPWIILGLLFLILSNSFFHFLPFLGIAIVLTSLYGNYHFTKKKTFSMRSSAIGKVVVISLVWLIIIVFIPLFWNGQLNNQSLIYLLMQFLFLAMLTIPFDIYDAQTQKQLGFSTLVSEYGIESTKKICRGLSILCWICAGFLGLPYLIIMSVIVLVYLKILQKVDTTWSFEKYTLYFDGLLFVQALVFIIVELFNR